MSRQTQPPAHLRSVTQDDQHLPEGECRYILLNPEAKGLRCACVGFALNKFTLGSACDCGHQACYHVTAKHGRGAEDEELQTLKKQIARLEKHRELQSEGGEHSLVARLGRLEELVEKYSVDTESEFKTAYRGIEGLWQNVGALQKYRRLHDDRIEYLIDSNGSAHDDIAALRSRLIDLDDVSMRLEDRVDVIASSSQRAKSTVVEDSSAVQALLITGTEFVPTSLRPRNIAAHAWTVHVSLLPTASQPFPFEKDTMAYKRCLSRGLHRVIAIPGLESQVFSSTVSQEFVDLLQGRPWMPLVAKLCDAETLQGHIMLRQLPASKIDSSLYDHDFLKKNCATINAKGKILDLYIAMCQDTLSWHDLKVSKSYLTGLEACWGYDPVLDGTLADDDVQNKACLDEDDKTSAGDLLRVWSPPTARLKRTATAVSRTSSFDSADGETKRPKLQNIQCAGPTVERVERRAEAV